MIQAVKKQSQSPFEFHEFFFSTTDKYGVIRFGNDVFVRVSAYPKEKMLGAPHSLIRHPDMPRAVFKIFWDTVQADKAIGAYVKNLAGNGSYYWVFAFAFPIEEGYLSIRFKPSSEIFQVVQKIYEEVRSFEKENRNLNESVDLLNEKIRQHGFKNYEDFMVKATLAELKSRALHVNEGLAKKDFLHSGKFQEIAETTNATLAQLNGIFEKVSFFQKSNDVLVKTLDLVDSEFGKLKFISINMTIAAAKFGSITTSLGVVSKEFAGLSSQIEKNLIGLSAFVQNLAEVIQQCLFRASALNLQMLMVDFFVKESLTKIQTSENAFSEMVQYQKDFSNLFKDYSKGLKAEVTTVLNSLSEINNSMEVVPKFFTGLEVIRRIGAVESARVDEVKHAFTHYLEEMDSFIQLLRSTTETIGRETDALKSHSKVIASAVDTVAGSVDSIFSLASSLGQPE